MGGSPPLEEYGLAGREVVRGFVVISYSLTTPSASRPPLRGGEPGPRRDESKVPLWLEGWRVEPAGVLQSFFVIAAPEPQ